MNSDLVHSASSGPAKDHAGPPVEAESLKLGVAVLAVRADRADTNLVAHHLDGLLAGDLSLRELSLNPANVFLLNLPSSDLLLQLSRLLGVPAEQEETGSESIQAMNGAEIFESVLLAEDEDNSVVAVAATRVNRDRGRLVDHNQVVVEVDQPDLL